MNDMINISSSKETLSFTYHERLKTLLNQLPDSLAYYKLLLKIYITTTVKIDTKTFLKTFKTWLQGKGIQWSRYNESNLLKDILLIQRILNSNDLKSPEQIIGYLGQHRTKSIPFAITHEVIDQFISSVQGIAVEQ
jgi:hypothetical protein